MRFFCNGCGSCCRRIGGILPDFDRGDGVCMHLLQDSSCAVYSDRPAACKVDLFHLTHDTGMSLEQWQQANNDHCVRMQMEDAAKG